MPSVCPRRPFDSGINRSQFPRQSTSYNSARFPAKHLAVGQLALAPLAAWHWHLALAAWHLAAGS